MSPPAETHGSDTLRVQTGVVVGRYKQDVFVELGERSQGVARLDAFGPEPPKIGASFDFTLRGQEETLWILELAERPVLSTWAEMEVGALVEIRVVRTRPGGLECKVGKLHAFMPKSQCGVKRGHKVDELIGKNLPAQVLEVDGEKQRILVSHRAILKATDLASKAAREGRLVPGMKIEGRVTRVERYGVFLRFGRDLTGLAHRSELSWGYLRDAREHFAKGDRVPAVVLTVRQAGKRIGLGVKQLQPNPWTKLDTPETIGRFFGGRVVNVQTWGAQVEVEGVVGFVPAPDIRGARGPHRPLVRGEEVTVRIVDVEALEERLDLSLRTAMGKPLRPEDLLRVPKTEEKRFGSGLGKLLGEALKSDEV